MAKNLNAGFPSGPLVNPATGEIDPVWRAFLVSLFSRTGGALGLSSDQTDLRHALDTESQARTAGDSALSASVAIETAKRSAADDAEAAARRLDRNTGAAALGSEVLARTAADTALGTSISGEVSARTAALTAEATARGDADTTLSDALGAETLARIAGDIGSGGGTGTAPPYYLHNQTTPAASWVIDHGMGRLPSVTVIDTTQRLCDGDVTYDSDTQVTLTFFAAFAGVAYLV